MRKGERDRGNGKQAGGVAICYKSENIEMRAVKMPATEFEVLCSIGQRMGQRRKILVIAIYIPSSYSAEKSRAKQCQIAIYKKQWLICKKKPYYRRN